MKNLFLIFAVTVVTLSSYALQPARQNAVAALKCSGINAATGKPADILYVYNNGASLQIIGGGHANMFVHLKNENAQFKLYQNAKYQVAIGKGKQKGIIQVKTLQGQDNYVKVGCYSFGK